ncbi:hypothetical protein Vretimale_8841 [Volvox reticuliferus]|uniref:Uncharacterized protein n=1 Tax=Volvox reticuliferus TaxID=1737510 RepID=A0A8J4GBP3_9CHLO|nr:hypothetical protein Vretimale_8841 [Volvox reticuliferus]
MLHASTKTSAIFLAWISSRQERPFNPIPQSISRFTSFSYFPAPPLPPVRLEQRIRRKGFVAVRKAVHSHGVLEGGPGGLCVTRPQPRHHGACRHVSNGPGRSLWGDEEAKPSQAKPSQAKPSQAKPSQAKPSQAKPSQAKPSQAKPSQAKPSQAKPSQAKPSQAKPNRWQSGTVERLLRILELG